MSTFTPRLIPSHKPPVIVELMCSSRADFETLAKAMGWPLGTVTVNGAFNHYFDRGTDDSWIGWQNAARYYLARSAHLIRNHLEQEHQQ